MKKQIQWIVICVFVMTIMACATSDDLKRLERKVDLLVDATNKVDRLLDATNRSTLEKIFGSQSAEIANRIEVLDENNKFSFQKLQQDYVKGTLSIKDVRQKMLNLVGNDVREVANPKGFYIRNVNGKKLNAISKGTKIKNCRILNENEIPQKVSSSRVLKKFLWGHGMLDNKFIIFPWELTISTFTKEIVENTARRTAEEFIKMGGDKKWNKPIYIEMAIQSEDNLKIKTKESEHEVYVITNKEKLQKEESLDLGIVEIADKQQQEQDQQKKQEQEQEQDQQKKQEQKQKQKQKQNKGLDF